MTMSNRICRRMSPRCFALSAIGLTVLLCVYYTSYTSDVNQRVDQSQRAEISGSRQTQRFFRNIIRNTERYGQDKSFEVCPKLTAAEADVNTVEVYKDFEFQPYWMKSKEYWDKTFEDRYERQKMDPERPHLKVIIVPHSHNDPGWLKTFENYFHSSSRQIMNNMVAKLQQYKNLTFMWSEISFLNAWWEEAHPSKQRALKDFVHSGRLEITTGGWVMTDEANSHVYAMVDQLIEGHQWVLNNLGIKPQSGWSVDPFGHGSTVPYLLAASGLKGTVIQRIHYAWKQWLAMKQYGDFRWIPNWTPADPYGSILTHNQPFDIYSIKHSCGPHPYICLNFDFRKVQGEYTEYSLKAQAITDKNVKEKAELLLEQYARTGSLFPHNTVLMPLGDDFRYNVKEEWDQQYTNYMKLIDYINANKNTYKTDISFGTPAMYFEEIVKRYSQFPTLKGDFFVYSDIFTEGRPAYWSGYFTTRPFMKLLDRELESSLRGAEILYTIALNKAKQNKLASYLKVLERDFEKLIRARRYLGLFQHHDAITGTSKSFVMRDYGLKLFEGIRDTVNIQQNALQSLLFPDIPIKPDQNLVLSDIERESFEKLPRKTPLQIGTVGVNQSRRIIVYNSLSSPQEQVIQLRVNTSTVKVVDSDGLNVAYQINPVWDLTDFSKMYIAADEFELVFIAKLPELSVTSFNIVYEASVKEKLTTIYCKNCQKSTTIISTENEVKAETLKSQFNIKDIPPGDIQLENNKFKVLFNGNTGFMKTITRKHNPKIMQCGIQFAAYRSAQFHSGAYLFMPDPNERDYEKDVLSQYKDQKSIIITSGPLSTEITVIYGPFLMHTVTVYLAENSTLSNGIYIENAVDFENPPKNRETELFMRIMSDVQNGEPPEYYSDLNGFNMQRRVKIERIGLEGNYYPTTTTAYIQDNNIRLSLLVNHAQGSSSWQPGFLEVMLDRRTLYDDSRGMGEGLVDNRKTVSKYWLLVEDISQVKPDSKPQPKRFDNGDDPYTKEDVVRSFNLPTEPPNTAKQDVFSRPSLYSNHLSNSLIYPASIFIVDSGHQSTMNHSLKLINKPFPCDTHLLTLRTQPDPVYSQFPSSSALMVLHRQGHDCAVGGNYTCDVDKFAKDLNFEFASVKEMELKTLTGLDTISSLHSFGEIYLEPLSLKTLNVTFG
ncbi:alpha-mannosidase 2 [Diabrotica virgifera virgifera]|uniref:Alpha-mannosidase n=2 Tax=Diabrotica virgifera virgifera TaxID=50390 RepID=A0ABM5K1R0_DIAVI|nr:alpha-mannosidase 2 [Diabrotica virgifera virgifera]XP_050504123.1 alpha-mannosidase 2 [Diabrotica virgifera virgifera]